MDPFGHADHSIVGIPSMIVRNAASRSTAPAFSLGSTRARTPRSLRLAVPRGPAASVDMGPPGLAPNAVRAGQPADGLLTAQLCTRARSRRALSRPQPYDTALEGECHS